jgi:DNA-binding MarR family transcriptional regulator
LRLQPSPPRDAPVGLLAALVNRAARQLVAALVEPMGLSTPQFWALVHLAEENCSSQGELAARMQVDEGTACRVVRSLTEARWVTAVRDRDDRRRIRLTLAPAGKDLVDRTLPIARGLRSAIESALTPEERAATRAGLLKVLTRLSSLAEERAAPLTASPRAAAARPPSRPRQPSGRRVASPRLHSRGAP